MILFTHTILYPDVEGLKVRGIAERRFACGIRGRHNVSGEIMVGLTVRQSRFVDIIARDEEISATKAALSAGYSEVTAAQSGSDNLKKDYIQEAIQRRRDELAAAAGLTPEWILREWMLIAAADPSELVSVVVKCCESCWALAMPDLPPNPDCNHCKGAGVRFVQVADTKKLKGPARKLFAGAKQTKDGIEIKMRDQDGALAKLADYLGMQNKSAAAVAVAVARNDVKADDLTDDQLAAIVAAGMVNMGVSEGVPSAGALPSKTIDATLEPI